MLYPFGQGFRRTLRFPKDAKVLGANDIQLVRIFEINGPLLLVCLSRKTFTTFVGNENVWSEVTGFLYVWYDAFMCFENNFEHLHFSSLFLGFELSRNAGVSHLARVFQSAIR